MNNFLFILLIIILVFCIILKNNYIELFNCNYNENELTKKYINSSCHNSAYNFQYNNMYKNMYKNKKCF